MSDDLSSRVLDILGNPSKPVHPLSDILRSVGRRYTKREVNQCLYGLKRQRRVTKVTEMPPEWALTERQYPSREGSFETVTGRGSHERGRHRSWEYGRRGFLNPPHRVGGTNRQDHYRAGPPPPQMFGNINLQPDIMHYLTNSRPMGASEMARTLGMRGPSSINQTLYEMERGGALQRVHSNNGPPLWTISSNDHHPCPRSPNMFQQDTMPSSFSYSHSIVPPTTPPHPAHSHNEDLNSRITAVLSSSSMHLTALDIARAIGMVRPEINPCLYAMEKQGMVRSIKGEGPPKWALIRATPLKTPPTLTSPDRPVLGRGMGLYRRLLDTRGAGPSNVARQLEGMRISENTSPSRLPPHPLTTLGVQRDNNNETNISNLSTPDTSPLQQSGMGISPSQQSSSSPLQQSSMGTSPQVVKSSPVVQHKECASSSSGGGFHASVVGDLNKNPVSLLLEYCQANKYDLEFKVVDEFGEPHLPTFVMEATFNDMKFHEQSSSKKDAKRLVAEKALQYLRVNRLMGQTSSTNSASFKIEGDSFQSRIAALAHEHHAILESTSTFPQPGRKVIACFVLEDATDSNITVISFGTGTRCISGERLSMRGDVVNDSHAEVLARRGLVRFLYDELRYFYINTGEKSIFEPVSVDSSQSLVKIKDRYRFHLYISTAPCGDGAQFSRDDTDNREPSADGTHRPVMSSKQQGVLRTKMEGGEGTIPIAEAQQQTWDGIQQGERLRTMSCSDKIARWNVLGLQGALLSHFVCPIYMSSLTLGSLHHHGHLSRAVCCRFDNLKGDLLPPYTINHPALGRIGGGDEMKRHTEKTTHYSINWAKGDEYPEVTNGMTGRPVTNPTTGTVLNETSNSVSRVSKAAMLSRFASVCESIGFKGMSGLTYNEAKNKAVSFQRMKESLYKFSANRGYGVWMRKPPEQSVFTPQL